MFLLSLISFLKTEVFIIILIDSNFNMTLVGRREFHFVGNKNCFCEICLILSVLISNNFLIQMCSFNKLYNLKVTNLVNHNLIYK